MRSSHAESATPVGTSTQRPVSRWSRLLRRGGAALLAFYFVKGLLWLVVPYLIGQGLFGCAGD